MADDTELIGELRCRPVRYEDKQQIIDIEVYQGKDYFGVYFDHYFYEEAYKCPLYCGEVHGTLVTFIGLLIMDEGRSVQFIGRRTKVGHEGRGYSNIVKDYSVRCLRRRYPRVRRFYSVSQSVRHTDAYLQKRMWKVCMEMSTMNIVPIEPESITLPTDYDATHMIRLKDPHVPDYIIQHCQHLHPENLFLVQYKVFQLTVPNLTGLIPLPSYVKLVKGHVLSLSCRTDYHCKLGIMHQIDIRTLDYNEVLAHLQAHFTELKALDSQGRKRLFKVHISPRIMETCRDKFIKDLKDLFNVEAIPEAATMKVMDESQEIDMKYQIESKQK